VLYRFQPAAIPGMAVTEMRFEHNAMTFDFSQLQPFMERLLNP